MEDENLEVIYHNPKMVAEKLKASPYYFRLGYVPGRDIIQDFQWTLKALWVTPSDKQFVMDEVHKVVPVNATTSDVDTMLTYARHDKLGFLGASQRIADVSKDFTSACRMVILFNPRWEANDFKAIRDRYGDRVEQMARNLRTLDHDDITNETKQVPQCLVLQVGHDDPRVYDFAVDDYVTPNV